MHHEENAVQEVAQGFVMLQCTVAKHVDKL